MSESAAERQGRIVVGVDGSAESGHALVGGPAGRIHRGDPGGRRRLAVPGVLRLGPGRGR